MRVTKAGILALSVVLAGDAVAEITAVGDPGDDNSWSQGFASWNMGPLGTEQYDFIGAIMTSGSGDYFESPVFFNFSVSGWSNFGYPGQYETIVAASGPLVPAMDFSLRFRDPSSNPLAFDIVFFNGDDLVEAHHATWNGATWSMNLLSFDNYGMTRDDIVNAVVPLPTACTLAGAALIALANRRRRTAL